KARTRSLRCVSPSAPESGRTCCTATICARSGSARCLRHEADAQGLPGRSCRGAPQADRLRCERGDERGLQADAHPLGADGDGRTHRIWETVTNSAAARPASFWVVIDEAHKGMAETVAQREEATTIVQKFIKGSNGELPPMPLIFGISATPERFNTLLSGTP